MDWCDSGLQRDMEPGDIFETPDGSRYLVLCYGTHIYVGNRDLTQTPAKSLAPHCAYGSCTKVGQVKYKKGQEPTTY